ncbi:MAG: hypothetical protein Q9205_006343 [Flavoplaca limonia]
MDLRVPQVFSYIRKKHLHLLAFPSKYLREQPERESLEAVFDLDKSQIRGIDRASWSMKRAIALKNVRGVYPSPMARLESCISVLVHSGIQRPACAGPDKVPDMDSDQSLVMLAGGL